MTVSVSSPPVQAARALSDRDKLKKQLESPSTLATPSPQYDDVMALQERIVQLQQKLSEGATPSLNTDMEEELAEKSVSARTVV